LTSVAAERAPTEARTDLPPVARSAFVVAGAKLAFLLAIAGVWGIHRDEFYYLAGGRRLDWGYVDHPILTPLLYRVDSTLFGSSQFGLHVVAALVAAALVLVGALLARELGGGRKAQTIAAVGVALAPFFVGTSHFLSTVSVDILMWSIGLLLFTRLLRTHDTRLWVAIGAVGGIGLLNKNTMAFWAIGVVAGLVLTRDRQLFRSRWLIIGALVAFVMQIPYLLWQIHHHWPTIEFLRSLQSHDDSISNPLLYFPYQFLLLGPVLVAVWLPGLLWLLRAPDARRFRALGTGFLVVLVLLFVLRGKAYYPASWYPALFAAGAVRIEQRQRWSLRAWTLLIAITTLPAMFFAIPIVPSDSSLAKTAVDADVELGEMLGWHDMARQVAGVAHALPANEQATLTIFTSNYSEAGALEYWRDELRVPQPISTHNNYWIWGYGPAHENGTTITVGFPVDLMRKYFGDVQSAGTVTNAQGIHNKEFGSPILVCRAQRVPWSQIWTETKDFS
jgi:Dolichyl-phosphate-mannose-protein mannosyltransferase